MIINLDNWLQVIGIAVVLMFALIGLIFFTYLVIRLAHESSSKFDNLNDYYDGCDMQKVYEQSREKPVKAKKKIPVIHDDEVIR